MVKREAQQKSEKEILLISGFIGVITFIFLYGLKVLNPFYTDWLLGKGDLSQHYLGWEFYRKSQWFFPFGLTDQLAYPDKTSVIFTDSIPLLAVPFKLFRSILPKNFQYFGWWGSACFFLQGYFATKILRALNVNKVVCMISSVFFSTAPVLLYRMYMHTSLGGQWLVLLSIYLYVQHDKQYNRIGKTSLQWGVVGFLIAAVHLYFLPMCGIFAGMYVFMSFIREKKVRVKYVIPLCTFVGALLLNTYLLGGFSSSARTGSSGLGEFSFNLNGFVNPLGYSKLLPNLSQYHVCQSEGMAYLGIGMILLFIFAVVGYLWNKRLGAVKNIINHADYLFIAIVMILFSASPIVTFGDKIVWNISCTEKIWNYWETFRSSGREIWGVYYLIMLAGIVGVDRCFIKRKRVAVILVSLCMMMQVIDLSEVIVAKHHSFWTNQKHELQLESEFWERLSEREYAHIVYAQVGVDLKTIFELAEYALEYDMTMSNFYFARFIEKNWNFEEQLSLPSSDSIYVLLGEVAEEMSVYTSLTWYEEDGYTVGIMEPLQ